MIPLLAVVRVDGPMRLRLWLPLFFVWVLLLPLVVLLLPFVLVLLVVRGPAVWPILCSVFEILSGMRGAHVDVRAPGSSVLVHIW